MNWTKGLVIVAAVVGGSVSAWALEVSPEVIPFSEPEIVNPMRGFYRRETEWAPQPPTLDGYKRYRWYTVEKAKGVFDFSQIIGDAADAKENGRKYAFRIYAHYPGYGNGFPKYIAEESRNAEDTYGKGLTRETKNVGHPDFIPDWNNENFLARAEAMIAAQGQTFDGDARISYVDIGVYGRWGEWNMPKGDPTISLKNGARLIDAYVAAFPHKWVLMRQGGMHHQYALDKSEKIGIRCDSIGGNSNYAELNLSRGYTPEGIEKAKNRWKTAPVITELFGGDVKSDPKYFIKAADQTRKMHVCAEANVSRGAWSAVDPVNQARWLEMGKSLGYRFNLTHVAAEASGSGLTVNSAWTNTGITPCYEKWEVTWQLRDGAGKVAWSGVSKLDLEKFLPTEEGAVVKVEDVFALPSDLAAGTYQLHLVIADPTGYRKPLVPAIRGMGKDGSYQVGAMDVRAAGGAGANQP